MKLGTKKPVKEELSGYDEARLVRKRIRITWVCTDPLSSCRVRIAPSIKKGRGGPCLFI